MKKVLALTDFSDNAYHALHYSTQLYSTEPCVFVIMNAYTELTPIQSKRIAKKGGHALLRQLQDESEESLSEIRHKIIRDRGRGDHSFEILSIWGNLILAVVEMVRKEKIDVVVMGNKGSKASKYTFYGSNTIKVMDRLKQCPMLMVPLTVEFRTPQEIALPTNYRYGYTEKLLKPLHEISKIAEAIIRVVHINGTQPLGVSESLHKAQLLKSLSPMKNTVHEVPHFTDTTKIIKIFAEEAHIDFLVLVHHPRSILEKWMREPVLKKISQVLKIPFLVLPFKD